MQFSICGCIFTLLINFFCSVSAQSNENDTLVTYSYIYSDTEADKLMEQGEVKDAIKKYASILQKDTPSELLLYNYACALSIDNQKDSAFFYLKKVISDFTVVALTDPDLLHLHDDEKWKEIEDTVCNVLLRNGTEIKKINLAKKLWHLYARDQSYLDLLNIIDQRLGKGSSVTSAIWDLKNKINKENIDALQEIIRKNGWPKITEVGERAALSAFLIIQHSNVELQKKYLPIIETLCIKNEAKWSNYAMMFDRISITETQKQYYGTQYYYDYTAKQNYLFPLKDKLHINQIRLEVGLELLDDFLLRNDIMMP